MSINVAPDFVMAGNATFTVSNGIGDHFTYRVTKSEPNEAYGGRQSWFVGVLTGPDNNSDYTYLGVLDLRSDPMNAPSLRMTRKSKYNTNQRIFKVMAWALKVIWQAKYDGYQIPAGYSIKHIGRCGKCGRALTVPASLDTGLGPECAESVGVEWRERNSRQVGLPI